MLCYNINKLNETKPGYLHCFLFSENMPSRLPEGVVVHYFFQYFFRTGSGVFQMNRKGYDSNG